MADKKAGLGLAKSADVLTQLVDRIGDSVEIMEVHPRSAKIDMNTAADYLTQRRAQNIERLRGQCDGDKGEWVIVAAAGDLALDNAKVVRRSTIDTGVLTTSELIDLIVCSIDSMLADLDARADCEGRHMALLRGLSKILCMQCGRYIKYDGRVNGQCPHCNSPSVEEGAVAVYPGALTEMGAVQSAVEQMADLLGMDRPSADVSLDSFIFAYIIPMVSGVIAKAESVYKDDSAAIYIDVKNNVLQLRAIDSAAIREWFHTNPESLITVWRNITAVKTDEHSAYVYVNKRPTVLPAHILLRDPSPKSHGGVE